jgi:predicted GNAT family acetyltransferase
MGLQRPREQDAAYRGVLALAKLARNTVGFLPDSAFAERARQGTLLVCAQGDRIDGYALYDLPRDEIRIVQVVVALEKRGHGLARMLVERISENHADCRGIVLHCRNDFPAHRLWPHLDFIPVGERAGRSFDGKPLTRWFLPFGQPDLFTYLNEVDTRPVATMDACVFFDLVARRPKVVARQLRADWLGEHVRLAVADQLLVEISEGKDPTERSRERAAAETFRLSATPAALWRPIYNKLLKAHPTAPKKDHNDLKHVAQSICSQAQWLITSDRAFVRRYATTAAELGGLGLVSPPEFVRAVDERARGDHYRPVDLAGTSVTRSEVGGLALAQLSGTFVNHADGEKIRELRATIDLAAARPDAVRLELIEVDGQPRGLVASELTIDALRVLLLRATAGRGETTIGRQLLALVRDKAAASGAEVIRVTDAVPSAVVRRSFRDEGFASTPDGVVAHTLTGSGTLEELRKRAQSLGSPVTGGELFGSDDQHRSVLAAAAERWFAPFRVLGADISNFMVPIRHGFATALFDVGLSQAQLFDREWHLGLRRELVYYRSPHAAPRGLAAPARLLWYVSGTHAGAGTIRAVSHLTEVAVGEYQRLFHRFKPLGVYTLENVRACADRNGHAMALRFSHTELLERPVPLDDYRRLLSGDAKSKYVPLQSPPGRQRTCVRVPPPNGKSP